MFHFSRLIVISLLILCSSIETFAQSTPSAAPMAVPTTAFISPVKYTNAFFGFSMPLPKEPSLQVLTSSAQGNTTGNFLFGVQMQRVGGIILDKPKLTMFVVLATPSKSESAEDVQKVAAGQNGRSVKQVQIGGKEFWKGESEQKALGGKVWDVTFATRANGYILQFHIASFDGGFSEQLEHCIEAISFFEPSRAAEIAGPGSRPYSPLTPGTATVPVGSRIKELSPGIVSANTYRNDMLGVTYRFPAGWTVNDKASQDRTIEAGHQLAWGNSALAEQEHQAAQQCDRLLLDVSKEAQGTKTKDVNPFVGIMAADPECSPSLRFPSSADDADAVQNFVKQLSFAGTPIAGQQSIKEFSLSGHFILNISSSFTADSPGGNGPLPVFMSIYLVELRSYWVAWIFMDGSETGLEDLKRNSIIAFDSP